MVRARFPASPLFSVSEREPRAGCFGVGGPPAGMVRAHLSASPLFSVSGREPRAGFFGIGGPAVGMVRARLPASPLFSVSRREPRVGNLGVGGPPAGFFKVRFAPSSPQTLTAPFRGANSSHKFCAAVRDRPPFPRRGLLPPAREPLKFRSGEQILHIDSAPTHKKHLAGLSARCFPLSNSLSTVPPRVPVPRGTFN